MNSDPIKINSDPIKNQTESQMDWDDIRTSPAFPAIIGGVAGAVGGVALMFVLQRLTKPKQTLPAAYDTEGNPMNVVYLPSPQQFRILGFTLGDLITLATVGLTLYRQVNEMIRESNAEQAAALTLPDGSTLPPSPAELPKPTTKSTTKP